MNYLKKELYDKVKQDTTIFEFIQNGSLDGMWYWDIESPENEWMSPRFWEVLGYDPGDKEHLASEWKNIINPIDLEMALDNFGKHCENPNHPYDQIVRYTHKNGSTVWIRCRGIAIRNERGDVVRMLGAHTDITELKETEAAYESELRHNAELQILQDKIRYVAEHDILTGLPNRALFLEHLEQSIALAKRKSNSVVLYFLDIDDFKQVNDCYGHLSGDLILKEIASRLKLKTRKSDFCSRLGGDEFVVLVEEVSDVSQSLQLAPALVTALKEPIGLSESTITVTVSIGVASYPGCAASGDSLLQCADIAMYQAKQLGRNQFRLYSDKLHQKVIRVQHLKQGLVNARRDQQFHLVYQPIYDTLGHIEGFEALLRWKYGREDISPSEFISVAEDHGFIISIGDWVLSEALDQFALWQSKYKFDGYISINLSLLQLQDRSLSDYLVELVSRFDIDPSSVHLEITETQLVDNFIGCAEVFDRLIAIGFHIALDDFGSGYASFKHLQSLPLSTLKIDKSFLTGVPGDIDKASTLDVIFSLASIMQLDVVVEGVESKDQSLWLGNYDCSQQGFYHASPHSSKQVDTLF